jgi:predicted TIM-barrel fold metal-dependent hydrolase
MPLETTPAPGPRIRELPEINVETNTAEYLSHATRQALAEYDDYPLLVDVDAHLQEGRFWHEIVAMIDNDVIRQVGQEMIALGNRSALTNTAPGMLHQSMAGRVPHQVGPREKVEDGAGHPFVQIVRRSIDAMGIDYQVIFPTTLLSLGMSAETENETALAYAYSKWLAEVVLPEDERIIGLAYLPFNSPKDCEAIVAKYADNPRIVGFSVCAVRHSPVHHNKYMRLYRMIEESGKALIFHAGPYWNDESFKQLNRFISMHALSFVHYNLIHMTNWVINALPERFPKLKTVWVESGLAWIPFLMQRLDHEAMLRQNEAPALKRRPSDYMRDMYYTSQPMEATDLKLLQATMEAMNADTQLLYASDWPHWDFDPPSSITRLPFLSQQAKQNMLGLNAARVFNLPTRRLRPRAADVLAAREKELAR